jgi:hypothetical protein
MEDVYIFQEFDGWGRVIFVPRDQVGGSFAVNTGDIEIAAHAVAARLGAEWGAYVAWQQYANGTTSQLCFARRDRGDDVGSVGWALKRLYPRNEVYVPINRYR